MKVINLSTKQHLHISFPFTLEIIKSLSILNKKSRTKFTLLWINLKSLFSILHLMKQTITLRIFLDSLLFSLITQTLHLVHTTTTNAHIPNPFILHCLNSTTNNHFRNKRFINMSISMQSLANLSRLAIYAILSAFKVLPRRLPIWCKILTL